MADGEPTRTRQVMVQERSGQGRTAGAGGATKASSLSQKQKRVEARRD